MKARIIIDNEVSFVQDSEQTIRIRTGRTFNVEMLDPVGADFRWVTTRDAVLQVKDGDPTRLEVTTLVTGTSEVQLQDAGRTLQFYLIFEVFDPQEAQKFSMGSPMLEPLT